MLRNGQDRSLRMWKSSGKILSEYTKRVLRRADGEHRPLQMEHASWYMAIVCSSALYELLSGEIYLAVSRCTFVHFILHIHLILHFCVPHLKFLEPKWSQTELFLFFNFFNIGSVSSYADINFTSRFNIPNTFYSIIFAICSLVNIK